MFSKQVWHDRKHQAEVFVNEEGVVSGAIISIRRGICLINPRPEILIALYQEAKIKRLLSINQIILTNNSPEFVRGLCTFLGYSRELRRRKPLDVYLHDRGGRSSTFVNSCCMQLMKRGGDFDLNTHMAGVGEPFVLGQGEVSFHHVAPETMSHPLLQIRTSERTIHYYDESYTEELRLAWNDEISAPDIAVRAVQLPIYRQIFVPEKRVITGTN